MERGTVRLDQQLEFHQKCDNVCGQFLKNQYYFRVEQHPVIDYKRLECSQVELEQYVEFHKKYNDFFCQQLKIQHHFRLEQLPLVHIENSKQETVLVRLSDKSIFEILRTKMSGELYDEE